MPDQHQDGVQFEDGSRINVVSNGEGGVHYEVTTTEGTWYLKGSKDQALELVQKTSEVLKYATNP